MKFKKLNENIGYGLDKIKDPILFDTNGLDKETIEVLRYLDHEGYDANAKDVRNYADAVAEYIDIVRSTGEDYSVPDWYRDTTENYPEELSDLSIRDYDYDIASESLSEAYVLDSEADWALDNKLVRTDLYTKVHGGKLSHVYQSEIDGRLYALELDPSAEGYRYVGTFPEYCEKITPEITQRLVDQRMLEDLDQRGGWEDPEWRKYWGIDDDSFYDDYEEEPLDESTIDGLYGHTYYGDSHNKEFVEKLVKNIYPDFESTGNVNLYSTVRLTFEIEPASSYDFFKGRKLKKILQGIEDMNNSEDFTFALSKKQDVVELEITVSKYNLLNVPKEVKSLYESLDEDYYGGLPSEPSASDESLKEWYDQYEPDQNYMYGSNYIDYVYDIETAAENAGRTDRLAGDKLKTKEEFLSTFDTSYDDRPEDEQDDEVLYFYYKKGYNKKRKFKDGRVYPALDESLIDPTQEDIEAFEEIVAYNDFDIEKKGKTLFGNLHYQIIDNQGAEINSQEALRERIKNFIEDIDKFEEDYNIPVTWNFGTNDEGILTAGIDLREKFVDDEDLELTTDDLNAGQWYESLDKSLKEDKEIFYIIKDRQGHQLSSPNSDDNELWDRVDSMDPYGKKGYRVVVYTGESLSEDTVKQNGKWVNKGKEGTHGKFNTKKQADAQRKAMFANGYSEDWK